MDLRMVIYHDKTQQVTTLLSISQVKANVININEKAEKVQIQNPLQPFGQTVKFCILLVYLIKPHGSWSFTALPARGKHIYWQNIYLECNANIYLYM